MPLSSAKLALAARTRAQLKDGTARKRREASGVSLAEAARTVGVSAAAMSAWELAKASPTAENAAAYGRLLDQLDPPAA